MALTAPNKLKLNFIEREMARKGFQLGDIIDADISVPLVASQASADAAQGDADNLLNGLLDAVLAANKEVAASDAGALSITKLLSEIDSSGAESRTLAAPGAGLVRFKVIRFTVDGGDVTLAGTNVLGDEAQTFTFAAVGDTIILMSNGGVKWVLIGGNLVAA